jgi:predicted nucleic acid-binding protein
VPFETVVSVPLVLEYEDALYRHIRHSKLTRSDVGDLLDYLCAVSGHQEIFFLWRPFLRDPRDDLVLEVAVAASVDCIVTHNVRDFSGAESFGIETLSPGEFLARLGELS